MVDQWPGTRWDPPLYGNLFCQKMSSPVPSHSLRRHSVLVVIEVVDPLLHSRDFSRPTSCYRGVLLQSSSDTTVPNYTEVPSRVKSRREWVEGFPGRQTPKDRGPRNRMFGVPLTCKPKSLTTLKSLNRDSLTVGLPLWSRWPETHFSVISIPLSVVTLKDRGVHTHLSSRTVIVEGRRKSDPLPF